MLGKDMGTGGKLWGRRIERLDADEAGAVLGLQTFAGEHRLADEVGLGGRNHAGEAEIAWRNRSVDLGMGDMALLDAHDPERLGAVGADAVLFTRPHDPVSDPFAVAGRHGEFIGEFAGEGDPEEPALEPSRRRARPRARS